MLRLTKKDTEFLKKKYPATKLYQNPTPNVPTLLYSLLVQEEILECLQRIEEKLSGEETETT